MVSPPRFKALITPCLFTLVLPAGPWIPQRVGTLSAAASAEPTSALTSGVLTGAQQPAQHRAARYSRPMLVAGREQDGRLITLLFPNGNTGRPATSDGSAKRFSFDGQVYTMPPETTQYTCRCTAKALAELALVRSNDTR